LKHDNNYIIKVTYSLLSGLLLTLSFPLAGFHWIAWIALVPLVFSSRNLSFNSSFRLGFIAGLAHYLTLLYWLVDTMGTYGNLPLYLSWPILFLLAAYLALYMGLFSGLLSRASKKPIAALAIAPLLWVMLEYIRSLLFSGFPWELAGYSQYKNLIIIQISDLTGVYGVSFLIVACNMTALVTLLWLTKKKWQGQMVSGKIAATALTALAITVGLTFCYGKQRLITVKKRISAAPTRKISVVQGNIEQGIKWDPAYQVSSVRKYLDLSSLAKPAKPDLVVWPETSAPFYFFYNKKLSDLLKNGIQNFESNFLIGAPSFIIKKDRTINYFNSAYLLDPDGQVRGKYDKVHLVPFGEYIPLKKFLPFAGKMVQGVGDFVPGQKGGVIRQGKLGLGILICYELIFTDLARAMSQNNADLLINITNDAWYGRSSAPYQHFSMAVFRAVENRRSLVRSANTGISGFIDPTGQILDQTDIFKEAVITKSLPLIRQKTIYTRFGDRFTITCTLITTIWLRLYMRE
jgi:apolipoprotein N-acyltransferase